MVSNQSTLRITIDGPAGAGKSTVAKKLATTLGYLYVDTGAMYRAVTLKALENGLTPEDEQALESLARSLSLRYACDEHSDEQRVMMKDRDVTHLIRSPAVNSLVSPVSAIAGVRSALVDLQRRMAREGGVVMEGRDIGSVVLPDAEIKVFLVASCEERARRRVKALCAAGFESSYESALAEIRRRDAYDSNRKVSPLTRPQGAIEIDSTHMSVEEVVSSLVQIVEKASDERCITSF